MQIAKISGQVLENQTNVSMRQRWPESHFLTPTTLQGRSHGFCSGGASHWRCQISNFSYFAQISFWCHGCNGFQVFCGSGLDWIQFYQIRTGLKNFTVRSSLRPTQQTVPNKKIILRSSKLGGGNTSNLKGTSEKTLLVVYQLQSALNCW